MVIMLVMRVFPHKCWVLNMEVTYFSFPNFLPTQLSDSYFIYKNKNM